MTSIIIEPDIDFGSDNRSSRIIHQGGKFTVFEHEFDTTGYVVDKYMAAYDREDMPCILFSSGNVIHSWSIFSGKRTRAVCVSRVIQFGAYSTTIAYMTEDKMVYRFDMDNPSKHDVMGKADILQYDGVVIRGNMYWLDVVDYTRRNGANILPTGLLGIDDLMRMGWTSNSIFILGNDYSQVTMPNGSIAKKYVGYDVLDLGLKSPIVGAYFIPRLPDVMVSVYTQDMRMHKYELSRVNSSRKLTLIRETDAMMSLSIPYEHGYLHAIKPAPTSIGIDPNDLTRSCLYQTN